MKKFVLQPNISKTSEIKYTEKDQQQLQQMNLYIVEGLATSAKPYHAFNYFEESEGRTNIIHVHRDHPTFQEIGIPEKSSKYILTAKPSQKLKKEGEIIIYIYEPSTEINNLKKVEQCYICKQMVRKNESWEDCSCSCTEENFIKKHICHKRSSKNK